VDTNDDIPWPSCASLSTLVSLSTVLCMRERRRFSTFTEDYRQHMSMPAKALVPDCSGRGGNWCCVGVSKIEGVERKRVRLSVALGKPPADCNPETSCWLLQQVPVPTQDPPRLWPLRGCGGLLFAGSRGEITLCRELNALHDKGERSHSVRTWKRKNTFMDMLMGSRKYIGRSQTGIGLGDIYTAGDNRDQGQLRSHFSCGV
jgi:hypothetical protein